MTAPRMRQDRVPRSNRRLIAFCLLAGAIGAAGVLLWARMGDESRTGGEVTHPAEDTRRLEDAGVHQPSAEAVPPDAATALEPHDANDPSNSGLEALDATEASAPEAASSPVDAAAADPVVAPPASHRHHRRARPLPGPAPAAPAASDPGAPPGAADDASLEQSPAPSDPARPAAPNPPPSQATETHP